MDGIAVRRGDLTGHGPWQLPIQATIAAGDPMGIKLLPGHAAKIMTGAPLPAGADTVIKIEDLNLENGNALIREKPAKGEFVRPRGDDIRKGIPLFDRGHILTPIDAGVLASVGLQKATVIPPPKIAILSTGSEIVEPGVKLKPGQRYDSNSIILKTLLRQNGYIYEEESGNIPDRPDQLREVLKSFLNKFDLLITTGGVSMGDYDYIPEIVRKLGGKIIFHKVKIKPGKPVLVASFKDSWLIGLPGNPVSVVTGYHLFVKRMICLLIGKPYRPVAAPARITKNLHFDGSRYGLVGAYLRNGPNGIAAEPCLRQDSGRLSSVKGINGLIMLEETKRSVSAGDNVRVEWLY
jgi:molybdopterin molybdotransferase